MRWPTTREELLEAQERLAYGVVPRWAPRDPPLWIGGCVICFLQSAPGPGFAGDAAFAAATLFYKGRANASAVVEGTAWADFEPGMLALREGPLLSAAVRSLPRLPDVLLVNATGRDHPRHAGLAVHLGAMLGVPTIGVTKNPFNAAGPEPENRAGARSALFLGREHVAFSLRLAPDVQPIVVHAGHRTDPVTAADVVWSCFGGARTPEPLRLARQLARTARSRAEAQWRKPHP